MQRPYYVNLTHCGQDINLVYVTTVDRAASDEDGHPCVKVYTVGQEYPTRIYNEQDKAVFLNAWAQFRTPVADLDSSEEVRQHLDEAREDMRAVWNLFLNWDDAPSPLAEHLRWAFGHVINAIEEVERRTISQVPR